MSSEISIKEETPAVEVLFEKELSSSEEPPQDEWSSLIFVGPEDNIKRKLCSEGLYDPGSGEICAKYILMSQSSVLRHPYYNYPSVQDPGIHKALFDPPPKIIYPDDGQDLYMALCLEMGLAPIRMFYRQLLEDTVDLKFYGINPSAFRAIAMALKRNRYVKVLDLADNWIGIDGCFHLGVMLVDNTFLTTINLTGCRIGVKGMRQLVCNLPLNRCLRALNLSKNELGDEGMEYLIKALEDGADISNISLRHNNLSAKSVANLAKILEGNDRLTHLDLGWNSIISENVVYMLCTRLAKSPKFQVLDLSWNALSGDRVGLAIKALMTNKNIRQIYLRNNKIEGPSIPSIAYNLNKAVKLEVLDLSGNPMSPGDTLCFVKRLWDTRVKLQKLLLDDVIVPLKFVEDIHAMRKQNYRKKLVVTHGEVKYPFVPTPPDMRDLIINRLNAMCKEVKKSPPDFPILVLEWVKQFNHEITQKDIAKSLRTHGVVFHDDMNNLLVRLFPGTITEKEKSMDLDAVMDYVKRKWPDKKLPPTPPRLPEPEPEPEVKAKAGKDAKKKK